MQTSKETNLLKNINIIPVFMVILFSVITIFIMVSYHYAHLQHAMGSIKKNYIHTNKILIKNETVKIVNIIKALDTSSKDSEEKTKMKILEVINSIQYNENGYVFIVDKNGDILINIKESLLWKNQINLQDKKGENIVKKILQTEGEGYISYFGIEGTHTSQSEKISYIKHYVPFGWAIGYGFHPSDIQSRIDQKFTELKEEHQSYLIKFITMTLIITLLLTSLLLILSKRIEVIFIDYKKKITLSNEENRIKDNILKQKSKMAAMGDMMANIAHQWRQPLSLLSMYVMSIESKMKKNKIDETFLLQYIEDWRGNLNSDKRLKSFL